MFAASNNNNSFSASALDTQQELGALGITNTQFKTVVEILSKRSNSLFFEDGSGKLRNVIAANPTQKSLVLYLGSKKKTGSGSGQGGAGTANR
ncbi:hypothetical protein SK128_001448 [Halocaridina rubra]|uniref:Uncharacterized protein n=1 Tax=Halocaridina rubra TaxID=373956 RepID=A0AAN8ZYX0_HALRR